MEKRLDKARTYLKELDAILLYSRENITYLSGYKGSDAVMFFTDTDAALFVDSRNTIQAKQESIVLVFEISKKWEDIFAHMQSLNIKTLGIESNIIDVDTYIQIRDLFKGIEIKPLGKQLKYLRVIKDDQELDLMKEAARISEEALDSVLESGIIGKKEKDIALDLEWKMRQLGASAVSFELIVASGPRSAMPHGVASERVIGKDEPVVIDFGCVYEGYYSDQTITVFTGKAHDEFLKAFTCVSDAQALAINDLCDGAKAASIDSLARNYISSKGYGGFFGHGLGHGVGMEVHEMPTISGLSQDILKQGMVFTIEPGIYIPDKFGIRLEDTLVITENSCQRITNLDKDALKIIS